MGVVLRGRDAVIERDVAIKLLPEEMAEDDTALARFLSEARAAGKLNHANVVSIYEIGQEGNAYYLVMELIPGGSVSDGLADGRPFSVLDATRIVIDAAKGLAAAHAVGLVHRDMKPANLMKAADGSVKITDFGLAKTSSPRAREMTQAGMVVGTPYFMSPEQCDAKPVDARSDIYSLGATYYSLLTGRNPYQESNSVIQVMFGHCQGEIPDPRAVNATIPTACKSAIVARAMAKSPDDRYQSAAEMLADLQAVAATLSGATRIEARPARTRACGERLRSRASCPRRNRRKRCHNKRPPNRRAGFGSSRRVLPCFWRDCWLCILGIDRKAPPGIQAMAWRVETKWRAMAPLPPARKAPARIQRHPRPSSVASPQRKSRWA